MKALICSAIAFCLLNAPAAASSQPPSGVWPRAGECSNIDPSTQRRCIGRRVEAKDRLAKRLYPRALAAVRSAFVKWGRDDKRLNPANFVEAHRDWQRFIASNCRAVGAIGGGSNSSVSDRITECYERELDERIHLYRQFVNGTYGL